MILLWGLFVGTRRLEENPSGGVQLWVKRDINIASQEENAL